MNVKSYLKMLAKLSQAELREMSELMAGMKGKDTRDAGDEARLQDFINSYPDEPDNGMAETLKQARLAAGRCCECGNLPPTQTEEQSI